MNISKCILVGINVQEMSVDDLVNLVGCEVFHWPLTYLGDSFGGNPYAESFWDSLLQRFPKD